MDYATPRAHHLPTFNDETHAVPVTNPALRCGRSRQHGRDRGGDERLRRCHSGRGPDGDVEKV
jgi:hypothetical protein